MFLFQQLTKDTQMHCRRVSELAVKLAVLCGEPVVNQTKISVAAIYHDIGKIKLPEEILNKKGPLTDEEYNLIKQHTNFGSILMKGYCSDDICQMIQYHHENIDGSGYYRLTEIPLGSRIIRILITFSSYSFNYTNLQSADTQSVYFHLYNMRGCNSLSCLSALGPNAPNTHQYFGNPTPISPLGSGQGKCIVTNNTT